MNDPIQSPIPNSNIEIVYASGQDNINLSGCTLITGFYGIGKLGFIAVNHMIQKLQAERIGYVVTDHMPPFISVKEGNVILPFEVYKKDNLVFIVAFFEPYKYEQRSFAKAIILWAKQMGISQAVLIGGLDSRLRNDSDILAKAVQSSAYKKMYPNIDIESIDEGLYVTGPLALLLLFAEIYDFPAISILPYAERSRPDPIGASHAVGIINDLLRINCGVSELIAEAENIEKEIAAMMNATENPSNEATENSDKGLFM